VKTPQTMSTPEDAIPVKEECAVRILQNDWVKRKLQISKNYSELVRHAKESITIINSYFLPRNVFLRQLNRSAKKGIRVTVVLSSISDVGIAKWAERHLYRSMLKTGIRLYEYQPAMLHAKLAIADARELTTGSYNVNGLSDYASVELNIHIKNEEFCRLVEKEIDHLIKNDCIEIDSESYLTKLSAWTRFRQWCSYYFLHLILRLFTFYFRQSE
jgi:cardiolipin synthase A/B